MLKTLRITAILEGLSWIGLIITMTLKYGFNIVGPNKLVGNIHGFLFIAFCLLVVLCHNKYKWNFKKTAILLISSVVPFGTFYTEKKYLQDKDNL